MIAALAPPSVSPAAMCSTVPAPPEAMTGTFTASATARVIVEVVAGRGAVRVDAVHHDLAGAERSAPPHPLDGIHAGGLPGAVDEDLVAARDAVARPDVLHLRREHDALRAEGLGAGADDVRVANRHRVDADLLGTRLQHREHVVEIADAAADGERDEDVLRDLAHGVQVDRPPLRAGQDVVEDDLVDLVPVQLLCELRRGRDVDVVLELLGLRDAPVDDVEARDQALGQHDAPSQEAKFVSTARPISPLFSAWNCVAAMLPVATIEQNDTLYSVVASTASTSSGTAWKLFTK